MHSFEDLKDLYYTYIHNPLDRKKIEEAYELASEKHKGVLRKTGEPYIQHPIEVAYILAELTSGPATLISALLHDTVEDTDLTIEEIKERFGSDVACIVDALTKIQRMKLSHRTEQDFEAEDHRKIFLGMARDVRVILVKLADRLHNLRTLEALSPERQKAIAKETLDVFTPIAHRLGIYTMQSEMEDLSLKYLEPDKYRKILHLLDEKENNRQESLQNLKKRIADILFEHHIPCRMESRVKSIFSIYRKMYQKGYSFDEIYDVLAVRVITKTELNCYEILGIIHATYKPVPGRFKDYIAMPKPNMYQSLHTTIVSGDGNFYEVQIRTEEMDQIAESGIAAHWRYKDGENYNPKEEQRDIEEKLHWFRDFVSMSGEQSGDAKDYVAALSHDIFNANVYVFTPLGKVIELPTGSTTLDFAYKIHTKVGEKAVGAIVNGVLVPLSTELKTGDLCEIKTSKTSPGPNRDWLEIAKTSSAKNHIRKFLQKKESLEEKESNIQKGKNLLINAFKEVGVDEEKMEEMLSKPTLLDHFHMNDLAHLYEAINNRQISTFSIAGYLRLRKKEYKLDGRAKKSGKSPIYLANGENLALKLAHCCSPIPGDEIIGYVSKGKGITVHRASCPNVRAAGSRLLHVEWEHELGESTYPVAIEISAKDRPGLIADLLQNLASREIPVSDLRAHLINTTMNDIINMTIYVKNLKQLDDVFAGLKSVKNLISIRRLIH